MSMPVIPMLQPNRTLVRIGGRVKMKRTWLARLLQGAAVCSVVVFALANVFWVTHLIDQSSNDVYSNVSKKFISLAHAQQLQQTFSSGSSTPAVRHYPPHRYYQLNLPYSQQPDFLTTQTEYIHGEWPVILQSDTTEGPFKLHVDQSEWWTPPGDDGTLPFADGTNPSILTMERLTKRAPAVASALQQHYPGAQYLVTVCMTDSQCSWKDEPQDVEKFHISTQGKPTTVRTVLLVLDQHYHAMDQTTIYLERNAPWGKRLRQAVGDTTSAEYLHMPALDDARLFVHNNQVWVSFREGKGFGWDNQVLNPIHFQFDSKWQARLLATETTSFCCGRNMALMQDLNNDQHLKSLTWVDPVTTVTVDTTPLVEKRRHRRLAAAGARHKSHIHGTNAFMVDLPNNNNNMLPADDDGSSTLFLGVAHFHRPNDRKPNPYARFGHHYTHAFYTVQSNAGDADKLVGLSAEFVLPAAHVPNDAEVIQFASGLELRQGNEIIIAYGINDCEAAIATFDLQVVLDMLRPVPAGKQVLDYMKPLQLQQEEEQQQRTRS